MSEPLFVPASFFILRVPSSPYVSCESYRTSLDWIDEVFQRLESDDLFREAVLIASPSLYEAIKKRPIKYPEKLATSLLCYAIRYATRATPFGLFSSVAMGHWAEETKVDLTHAYIQKRTRPDMQWIWALIQAQYHRHFFNSDLAVSANPLAKLVGDRIHIDYLCYGEKDDEKDQNISVKANELTLSILFAAKQPITYEALSRSVHESLPYVTVDKSKAAILHLLRNQFLVPTAIPSLLNVSLSDLPFEGVHAILEQMSAYDKVPLGKGEQALLQLQQNMKNLAHASSCIQVDLGYKHSSVFLSKKVANELSRSLELLWRICSHLKKNKRISRYHALFVEKYGTSRTVPLLELLSEEKGLGSLEGNPLLQTKEQPSPFHVVWFRWLHHRLQESLHNGANEIVLHPEVVEHLLKITEQDPTPFAEALPSCDVFFKVISPSQEEIDLGNFDLVLSQIALEGGSSIGRFLDFLDVSAREELHAFLQEEENTEPHSDFVEVSYWPKEARCANVAIQPCLRKYAIDPQQQPSPQSMNLDDIYVGATSEYLYLTDKYGKLDIVTRVGNLLNLKCAPEPLRLLREITLARYAVVSSDLWEDEVDKSIYLPRLRYGKTLISLATWNLDGTSLAVVSKEDAIQKFTQWAEQWRLPNQVVLAQGDNHLLFNRDHPVFLKKIATSLLKGERIRMVEHLAAPWVTSGSQAYVSECVAPFVKNKAYSSEQKAVQPIAFNPVGFQDRWKLLGGNWLYFKVYLGERSIENFLLHHLSLFLKKIGLPWFYVRYQDPLHHLRVRIEVTERDQWVSTLFELEKASPFWMERGFIKKLELCPYEREIERYGGIDLIQSIEKLFCADTLSVIHLLRSVSARQMSLPSIITQTLSVMYFLEGFQFTCEQKIALLERSMKNKQDLGWLDGYREHKRFLSSHLEISKEEAVASPLHRMFQEAYHLSLHAKGALLERAGALTETRRFEIVDSLLHMHCNRLNGENRDEAKSRHFAYKALVDLERKHVLSCV